MIVVRGRDFLIKLRTMKATTWIMIPMVLTVTAVTAITRDARQL
jgi:hypothetical protein